MDIYHSLCLYNHTPKIYTDLYPYGMCTRSKFYTTRDVLGICHVWGYLAYILEPRLLKSGVTIPKWSRRSRRESYIVFTRNNSNLVSLVINFITKSILLQYPVLFDDVFASVQINIQKNVEFCRGFINSPSQRFWIEFDEVVDP